MTFVTLLSHYLGPSIARSGNVFRRRLLSWQRKSPLLAQSAREKWGTRFSFGGFAVWKEFAGGGAMKNWYRVLVGLLAVMGLMLLASCSGAPGCTLITFG